MPEHSLTIEPSVDLSLLLSEPAGEYHAQATNYLSSHQLMDFMTCPWFYRKKQLGLISPLNSNSPALLIGSAAHARILEGRAAYESQFALGGPINPRTQKPFGSNTKAFAEWAELQGKPVLSQENVDLIEQMASGVSMNDEAVDLILYGRAEGVLRTEYCGLPCQIRLDWVHPHRGIIDLKTTADLTWFENETKRRRYPNQMAFYQDVLAQAIGELVPVYLIGLEKIEPFRCGVWRLSDDTLAAARQENKAAIQRLISCQANDHWPTGYEDIRYLDVA